jgi:hypothetical protein
LEPARGVHRFRGGGFTLITVAVYRYDGEPPPALEEARYGVSTDAAAEVFDVD